MWTNYTLHSYFERNVFSDYYFFSDKNLFCLNNCHLSFYGHYFSSRLELRNTSIVGGKTIFFSTFTIACLILFLKIDIINKNICFDLKRKTVVIVFVCLFAHRKYVYQVSQSYAKCSCITHKSDIVYFRILHDDDKHE